MIWQGDLPSDNDARSLASGSQDLLVNGDVIFNHALAAEPLLDVAAQGAAIQLPDRAQGGDRRIDAVDDEAGLAVFDDLRHGAAPASDHRGSACHRLDHAEPKGFVEVDQVQ